MMATMRSSALLSASSATMFTLSPTSTSGGVHFESCTPSRWPMILSVAAGGGGEGCVGRAAVGWVGWVVLGRAWRRH
jgi:hypothetical protein